MKKPNKKSNAIKQRKSLKRAATRKANAKRNVEKLQMKKNQKEAFIQDAKSRYMEMVAKSFENQSN